MKLRFEVNQAEAFRRGIDCPKSIVTIEVNPADVGPDVRKLIADRMHGIDICQLTDEGKPALERGPNHQGFVPIRVKAALPTFEELVEAVQLEQALYDSYQHAIEGQYEADMAEACLRQSQ